MNIDSQDKVVTGVLKYFFPEANYGFLVEDFPGGPAKRKLTSCKDVFFHFEELNKNGCFVDKQLLINAARNTNARAKMLHASSNSFMGIETPDMSQIRPVSQTCRNAETTIGLRFEFNKIAYFGKYGLSVKATNIKLVEIFPIAVTTRPFQNLAKTANSELSFS